MERPPRSPKENLLTARLGKSVAQGWPYSPPRLAAITLRWRSAGRRVRSKGLAVLIFSNLCCLYW